jgi:hypothetical protein
MYKQVALCKHKHIASSKYKQITLRAYKRKASNPPATWAAFSYSKRAEALGSIWVVWLPELTDLGDRRSGSRLTKPSASDGTLRRFRTHVLCRTAAEVEREIGNKIKVRAEVFRAEDLGLLRVR